MVYSHGIEAATQRIEEIQSRFAAFEKTAHANRVVDETNTFGNLLHEKMQLPSSAAQQSVPLENLITEEANIQGVNPNLVKAVVHAESGFNPKAVSPAGAMGLMQLMPKTAQELGVQSVLDPQQNVHGGTKYLKSLLEKYQSVPMALAAYNAGPGAVDRYDGIPPYRETQTYVQRVLQQFKAYERQEME